MSRPQSPILRGDRRALVRRIRGGEYEDIVDVGPRTRPMGRRPGRLSPHQGGHSPSGRLISPRFPQRPPGAITFGPEGNRIRELDPDVVMAARARYGNDYQYWLQCGDGAFSSGGFLFGRYPFFWCADRYVPNWDLSPDLGYVYGGEQSKPMRYYRLSDMIAVSREGVMTWHPKPGAKPFHVKGNTGWKFRRTAPVGVYQTVATGGPFKVEQKRVLLYRTGLAIAYRE